MQQESLSFPQAISATQSLMIQITESQLNESQIEQKVTSIIKDKNSGRGFFVAYLTASSKLSETPSQGIINAFKSSISVISELLVKNLAMSSAMVVAHNRDNNIEGAQGSQQVCQRTSNLIQQVDSKLIQDELLELHNTIQSGKGKYQAFFERWNYDAEQQQAIQNTINNVLNQESKND